MATRFFFPKGKIVGSTGITVDRHCLSNGSTEEDELIEMHFTCNKVTCNGSAVAHKI